MVKQICIAMTFHEARSVACAASLSRCTGLPITQKPATVVWAGKQSTLEDEV